MVKANDVIFSRRGDLTRSAYISDDRNNVGFFCGTGCLLLRVPAEIIHGGWFSLLYGTPQIQSQVDGLAVGSTMANLNSSILGKLRIPAPSSAEQAEIFKRIEQSEYSLVQLKEEQNKRLLQKKGLMQDLLTGKVPVPV
ncbi:MAG: restriction endonuclease subunit S [Endozoicomonas sp.]